MEYVMFNDLTADELLLVDGGWNSDTFAKGVAAVGTFAGICGCAPVAVGCAAFCAGYYIARSFK